MHDALLPLHRFCDVLKSYLVLVCCKISRSLTLLPRLQPLANGANKGDARHVRRERSCTERNFSKSGVFEHVELVFGPSALRTDSDEHS